MYHFVKDKRLPRDCESTRGLAITFSAWSGYLMTTSSESEMTTCSEEDTSQLVPWYGGATMGMFNICEMTTCSEFQNL